jgi:hypothetical protein
LLNPSSQVNWLVASEKKVSAVSSQLPELLVFLLIADSRELKAVKVLPLRANSGHNESCQAVSASGHLLPGTVP